MIHIPCEQGTTLWQELRRGIPTASQFDRIITNKTMKLSDGSTKYAYELIAEQMLGVPLDNATSGFMQRGSILEKRALAWYEFQQEAETEPVGFVLRDDRRVGCSPDRFVGHEGLLEIKCPAAATHVGYLLDDEGIGYRAQVQGQLWLTGRTWSDTLSFNPDMPCALVRVQRDEEYIHKLAQAVDQFLNYVLEMKIKLSQKGYIDAPEFAPLRVVA